MKPLLVAVRFVTAMCRGRLFIGVRCRRADPGCADEKKPRRRTVHVSKIRLENSLEINRLQSSSRTCSPGRSTGSTGGGAELPALAGAQSLPYPTYVTGPQSNGSWVVSSGQVITPAGTQVNLGIRVRAKAIALNPNIASHTAAVLTMGTSTSDGNGAVEVFDTNTGVVLQNYIPFAKDPTGSYSGIAYSADGKYLVFSQDSSNVTIASVNASGLLADDAQVSVPPNNSFINVLSEQPSGRLCQSLRLVLYVRALLILAASRSPRMARAPMPC